MSSAYRDPADRRHRFALAAQVAGAVVLIVGTFLPWLASGSVLRDSYRAMAVARRLTALGDGLPGAVLAGWPALGVLTAAALVLQVAGVRRVAAIALSLLAVIAGTVATAVVVLLPPGGFTVRTVLVGPGVTVIGAVLAVAGSMTTLAASANRSSRRAGGAR